MPEATPATTNTSGARILIIDDEAAIRDSLETLLTLEGFSVQMAPEGKSGMDMLTASEYDLLLLDLSMPGESGIDLLPRIKRLRPEMPVIMITAYGTVGNVVDASAPAQITSSRSRGTTRSCWRISAPPSPNKDHSRRLYGFAAR